jgi:alcohol dehydrogenase (cytochrome c)
MPAIRAVATAAAVLCIAAPLAQAANDWPSYNRTLTSDRYATLEKIDNKNVTGLKVICSFDTGEQMSFQTGLVQVDGALFGTTERDTFSIDPNSCKLNWRSHEDSASGELKVNRGLAWLDHRVFRGTADGKVIAYDAKNGKRLWATAIADATKGESVPAAPIAWNGLVFIGNAGGDNKGVKGRMYALDDKDGHIVWEFYLCRRAQQMSRADPRRLTRSRYTRPVGRKPRVSPSRVGQPGLPIPSIR